jgi:hypothetical protein
MSSTTLQTMPKRRRYPTGDKLWRIWPSAPVRAAVENIARAQEKNVSTVLEQLIVSALRARAAAAVQG